MQKFIKKGPQTIEAVQFDPQGDWPECVQPWGKAVPRDMSWGYIEVMGGKIHVRAGDWIFKDQNEAWAVLPNLIFQQIYEPV